MSHMISETDLRYVRDERHGALRNASKRAYNFPDSQLALTTTPCHSHLHAFRVYPRHVCAARVLEPSHMHRRDFKPPSPRQQHVPYPHANAPRRHPISTSIARRHY
jgi:hypothetical protein